MSEPIELVLSGLKRQHSEPKVLSYWARLLMQICIGCVLVSGSPVCARDSKEVRKHYSATLRVFLLGLDRSLSALAIGRSSDEIWPSVLSSFQELKPKLSPRRAEDIEKLLSVAKTGRPTEAIEKISKIRSLAIEGFRVVAVPSQIPDIEIGRQVYSENCSACHGVLGGGDGKLAQNKRFPMVPPPSSLVVLADSRRWSPFSLYNMLLVGIPGTAMQAYDETLTEQERWSVSFWLLSRPFSDASSAKWSPLAELKKLSEVELNSTTQAVGALKTLSEQNDAEILSSLKQLFPKADDRHLDEILLRVRRSYAFLKDTPRVR